MTIGARIAILLSSILLLTAVSGSTTEDSESWGYDASVAYEVNMTQIRTSFLDHGQIEVLLPDLNWRSIEGQSISFRNGNQWSEILPNGTTVFHTDQSILLEGRMIGSPAGTARILLGDHGLYGRIQTETAVYRLDPIRDDPGRGFIQQNAVNYLEGLAFPMSFVIEDPPTDTECQQVPAPQGCDWPCGTPTEATLHMDVEQGVRSLWSDWKDRFTAALTGYHGSWELWKDICVDLVMQNGSPRGVMDIATNTNVREALDSYRDWLVASSSRTTESAAYQLWTTRGLYRCPTFDDTSCPGDESNSLIGGANIDQAILVPTDLNKNDQGDAVGIMEAKKWRPGSYDPARHEDLARLSGHEASHTFGEGNHPTHCKSSSKCNHESDY